MNKAIKVYSLLFVISFNVMNITAQSVYMHEAQEDDISWDGIEYIMKVITCIFIGIVALIFIVAIWSEITDYISSLFNSRLSKKKYTSQDYAQASVSPTNKGVIIKKESEDKPLWTERKPSDWDLDAIRYATNHYLIPSENIRKKTIYWSLTKTGSEIYSTDGVQLVKLECPYISTTKTVFDYEEDDYISVSNKDILQNKYTIKEGTAVVCPKAINSNFLEEITIPQTVLFLGERALSCPSIKRIILPDSIIYIGDYALVDCSWVKELFIPQHVLHIGRCSLPHNLNKISSNSPNYIVVDNALYNKQKTRIITHLDYDKLFTIPESVKDITGAFAFNEIIEKIIMPPFIQDIGESSFEFCKKLTDIEIPDCVENIGSRAFMGCCSLKTINLPNSLVSIQRHAFEGCQLLESIIIPEGVRFLGSRCFAKCTNLKQVFLPSTIEQIEYVPERRGTVIFMDCTHLTHIYIPTGSKEKFINLLPQYVDLLFEYDGLHFNLLEAENEALTDVHDVNVPVTTEINRNTKLQDSTITEDDSNLDELFDSKYTFEELDNSIEDEYGVLYTHDYKKLLKINNNDIKEYHINSQTVVICDNAFEGSNIRRVFFSNNTIIIGKSAFAECQYLTGISLPNKLRIIGNECFFRCNRIEKIFLPTTLKDIGEYAFCECGFLDTVNIPSSINIIK
ncbi:MAG: leucine-rich repeat protein, partial [Bacteroidaceae bacterium]|nr:leucine-rich repeat protein [Bacteroidaceae bacterium]